MWFKISVFVIIAYFILASCSNTKSRLPDPEGNGSEILIVCDENLWNGPVGEIVKTSLAHNIEGLAEAEPDYTLIHVLKSEFKQSFQHQRNILMIDIDLLTKKSKIETLKDVWSRNQRVIKVKTNSDTAFSNLFNKHNEAIRELFNQNERAWFSSQNAISRNEAAEKLLSDQFGIDMAISSDFKLAHKMKDFIGLTSSDSTLRLLIYTYAYTDTSQLNIHSVLAERQKYYLFVLPEPDDDAVTSQDSSVCNSVSQKFLFRGMYALETRSSVSPDGKKASSSFLNYSVVDAPHHRIIVFDGSVSSPHKPKRNYLRQLEAIIMGAEIGSDF